MKVGEIVIKIDNFFFEVSDIEYEYKEIGSSKRTYNGTIRNNYIGTYKTFKLTIDNLSAERHGQLLYLVSKNRKNDTPAEHLVFNNLSNDEYLNGETLVVDIPLNKYSFKRLEGKKEKYQWELTLEEISTTK